MSNLLFNQIIDRFYKKNKNKFYSLFIFSFFAGALEFFGLVLIFQYVLFLSNPNSNNSVCISSFLLKYFANIDLNYFGLILGILIASIYIIKNIYMLFYTYYSNLVLEDLSVNIIQKITQNLLFQDFLKINSISNDVKIHIITKINFVIWNFCQKVVSLYSNATIAIILIAYLFIKFTLSACVATIFIGVLSFIEYKILKKNAKLYNANFSKTHGILNSLFLKIINSIKEIKLNNYQEKYFLEIQETAKKYSNLNKSKNYWSSFHVYFTEISIMMTFILVLVTLFYSTNFNNHYLISSIATICVVVLRLAPTINRMQTSLYSINSNKQLAWELIEFDKNFNDKIEFSSTKEKLPFNNFIELKNVSFSYDDFDGLKNINLKINKGDFVGIVGVSGCYKTTLSLIISGLIKPKNGEIIIDEQKLTEDNYQKWLNNIALLAQDYQFLFDSVDEISKDYFEKLGLNNINPNVKELSYGQKQRVALANILSKDKDVLILDEISSSSDVICEEKINNVLKELKGNKTIISIAHRLQILKHCDKIIYMGNGEIIDIGTFNELGEKYSDFKKIIELSNFSS